MMDKNSADVYVRKPFHLYLGSTNNEVIPLSTMTLYSFCNDDTHANVDGDVLRLLPLRDWTAMQFSVLTPHLIIVHYNTQHLARRIIQEIKLRLQDRYPNWLVSKIPFILSGTHQLQACSLSPTPYFPTAAAGQHAL